MSSMRLQSAMEYLTTYGWAIVILGVAIAALYALGVFQPQSFVGQQCVIPNFVCQNYFLKSNGLLMVTINQSVGSSIDINGVGCYQNPSNTEIQAVTPVFLPVGSSYTFNVLCYNQNNIPFNGIVGTTYSGSLIINYTNIVINANEVGLGIVVVKVSH